MWISCCGNPNFKLARTEKVDNTDSLNGSYSQNVFSFILNRPQYGCMWIFFGPEYGYMWIFFGAQYDYIYFSLGRNMDIVFGRNLLFPEHYRCAHSNVNSENSKFPDCTESRLKLKEISTAIFLLLIFLIKCIILEQSWHNGKRAHKSL